MLRLKADPFLGAVSDPQRLEDAMANLEKLVSESRR
jgi:hypothetical protein